MLRRRSRPPSALLLRGWVVGSGVCMILWAHPAGCFSTATGPPANRRPAAAPKPPRPPRHPGQPTAAVVQVGAGRCVHAWDLHASIGHARERRHQPVSALPPSHLTN